MWRHVLLSSRVNSSHQEADRKGCQYQDQVMQDQCDDNQADPQEDLNPSSHIWPMKKGCLATLSVSFFSMHEKRWWRVSIRILWCWRIRSTNLQIQTHLKIVTIRPWQHSKASGEERFAQPHEVSTSLWPVSIHDTVPSSVSHVMCRVQSIENQILDTVCTSAGHLSWACLTALSRRPWLNPDGTLLSGCFIFTSMTQSWEFRVTNKVWGRDSVICIHAYDQMPERGWRGFWLLLCRTVTLRSTCAELYCKTTIAPIATAFKDEASRYNLRQSMHTRQSKGDSVRVSSEEESDQGFGSISVTSPLKVPQEGAPVDPQSDSLCGPTKFTVPQTQRTIDHPYNIQRIMMKVSLQIHSQCIALYQQIPHTHQLQQGPAMTNVLCNAKVICFKMAGLAFNIIIDGCYTASIGV